MFFSDETLKFITKLVAGNIDSWSIRRSHYPASGLRKRGTERPRAAWDVGTLEDEVIMATQALPKEHVPKRTQVVNQPIPNDWTRPQAMAIPKEGYFKLGRGRYGPVFPQTPACYGFSVVAKVKPDREKAIRDYGKNIEEAVKDDPTVLAPLKLHYLRWVLFDIGSGLHFHVPGYLRHRFR